MDTIALTIKEQQRVAVIERVFRGERRVDRPRLAHSLCFKYRRVEAKHNTGAFHGAVLPLPKRSPSVSWAHKAVDLLLLDGSVQIFSQIDRIAHFGE